MALAFDLLASPTECVPRPSRSLRRAGHGNACACGLIPSLRNKFYGAGSIAAHPFDKLRAGSCKKRKDGAPSVGMVQCKDGPSALFRSRLQAHIVLPLQAYRCLYPVSMFISFRALNRMQYPVTLALPSFFPYVLARYFLSLRPRI